MIMFRSGGSIDSEVNRLKAEIRCLEIYVKVLEEKLREAYSIKK